MTRDLDEVRDLFLTALVLALDLLRGRGAGGQTWDNVLVTAWLVMTTSFLCASTNAS